VSSNPPAYVTVTDAAGRVLFRRLATAAEIEEATQIAKSAEAEAEKVLGRIAKDRDRVLAKAADAPTEVAAPPPPKVEEKPPKASAPLSEETDFLEPPEIEEPDFSLSTSEKPKIKKEDDDAFTAFGDEELDFLSGLDEEKGK
jgi:hypothetical protein